LEGFGNFVEHGHVYLLEKSCGETFAAHDAIPKNLLFEHMGFNEIFWNDTASICAQFDSNGLKKFSATCAKRLSYRDNSGVCQGI